MQNDRKASFMTITPKMAAEWLSKNKDNRPIRSWWVNRLVEHMLAGTFVSEGWDAIAFFKDGTLKNGQHRLTACVKANVPFESLVVTGLTNPQVYKFGDGGQTRRVSDRLNLPKNWTVTLVGAINSFSGRNHADLSLLESARDKYLLEIELVTDIWFSTPRKLITCAGIRGAFLRALICSNEPDKLARWTHLLYQPFEQNRTPAEKNIARFLDSVHNNNLSPTGGKGRSDIYRRLSSVLRASLQDRELNIIRACTEEVFPVDWGNGVIA